MIDTRSAEQRTLRFQSIDDCLAEIARIRTADAAGMLRVTGNWTAGQIMAHLAAWINYAYDGFPIGPPPLVIRWIIRLGLRRMLRNGMPRGVHIRGVKEGTTGMEALSTPVAADRLVAALHRLASDEEAKFPSPAFGAMSHADRIQLNLRHAELHLGFIAY